MKKLYGYIVLSEKMIRDYPEMYLDVNGRMLVIPLVENAIMLLPGQPEFIEVDDEQTELLEETGDRHDGCNCDSYDADAGTDSTSKLCDKHGAYPCTYGCHYPITLVEWGDSR